MDDEQELCGAVNPDMPHRTCLRVKGHTDRIGVWKFPYPIFSWHKDFAGQWKGEGDE